MTAEPIRVAVIVGSTRPGRFADTVVRWFTGQAGQREDMELDVIDLAEVDLPHVLPASHGPEVREYLDRIGRADCFVVVTPEYNHGYPASLKQAIDIPRDEWRAKPVGFVSYGGLAGGQRAVEQLRQVFPELHATTVRDTVSFAMAPYRFGEDGEPHEPDGCNAAAKTLLDQLAWWAEALRTARAARPY